MARVYTFGRMVVSIMESGKTMTWRVSESTSGQMAASMRENITMTRSAATDCIPGPMADAMRAGGTRANSMVSVHI